MNNNTQLFLTIGNEERHSFELFIRNLVFHQKSIEDNPLIVNFGKNCFYGEPNRVIGKDKNKYKKLFDYYTEYDIAAISVDKLYEFVSHKKSKYNLDEIEDGFSHIYLSYNYTQKEYRKIFKIIDNYIVILKSDNESSSYLFNLLKLNKSSSGNLQNKFFNIVISNVKKIEEAAEFFLKIKTEMQAMIGNNMNLNFIGPLMIDRDKASISLQSGEPHIRLFFEGALHGSIKYIDSKLKEMHYKKQSSSFFKKLSEIKLL